LGRDYALKFTFGAGEEHNPIHGAYIAINERCFHCDNVKKNKKTGEFKEIK